MAGHRNGGRKQWVPSEQDYETIGKLAGQGFTSGQIAQFFGLHPETFVRKKNDFPRIREEEQLGKAKAYAYVTKRLFDLIREGDKSAIFFYLKTQFKWRENDPVIAVDQSTHTTTQNVQLNLKLEEMSIPELKTLAVQSIQSLEATKKIPKKTRTKKEEDDD